ncbi:MAG: flagellar basal body L-ring protein FlgH [Magnetococcales bacterium]|nr:flagellar basal body L-ring protein FlgH [Magnetococcales bacterium]MBF0156217.1 flagellar basal body L-ring protein FlgH [Magnetococcales bacterium]
MSRIALKSLPVLVFLAMGVAGCGMTRATQRPPTPVASVRPLPPEVLAPKKGSIWQSTDRNTLFLDNKARNVGDVVTVKIFEKAKADGQAKTKLSRSGSTTLGLEGALDVTRALKSAVDLGSATATSDSSHDGSGETERESNLTATISCMVTEVLPNGNLRIEGRRDITVNAENQFILLSGIIRPEDITAENSVNSAQIADARIDYSGDGDMDDQQRPGWISRFFNSIRVL